MVLLPATTDADAVGTYVIRFGSCFYSVAAETAQICAICYRCYLSSAAVAEAIRAATVLAIPVAINIIYGGDIGVAPFWVE